MTLRGSGIPAEILRESWPVTQPYRFLPEATPREGAEARARPYHVAARRNGKKAGEEEDDVEESRPSGAAREKNVRRGGVARRRSTREKKEMLVSREGPARETGRKECTRGRKGEAMPEFKG